MQLKTLAVLGLCGCALILLTIEGRGTPAGKIPRRQLGAYKDYGHYPHKHDYDYKKGHHDVGKDHTQYRRRLEDKANESSDYSYSKDDYDHKDYGHDAYAYKNDDYKYKEYEHKKSDKGYDYSSHGKDYDDYSHGHYGLRRLQPWSL
ncbi:hypothetical protein Plhal304r1_c071g0160111 [Plasmopara halstedii]